MVSEQAVGGRRNRFLNIVGEIGIRRCVCDTRTYFTKVVKNAVAYEITA